LGPIKKSKQDLLFLKKRSKKTFVHKTTWVKPAWAKLTKVFWFPSSSLGQAFFQKRTAFLLVFLFTSPA
jgi:hypothetical protein